MRPEGVSYVHLGRELWGAVLYALTSEDKDLRNEVYGRVLDIAPQEWDADIDTPGVLESRVTEIGIPSTPPGWQQPESPFIPPRNGE